MAVRQSSGGWLGGRNTLVGLLFGIGFLGCGGSSSKTPPADDAKPAETKPSTTKTNDTPGSTQPVADDHRYRQSFQEATCADPPGEDCQRPADQTMTQKSTGLLYEKVKAIWDSIPLATADNKPLLYRVTLDTTLGEIDLELHPEWAPNHVRNFLALAKVGYYDGLLFDRTQHQISADKAYSDLYLIEAGCPLGTGEIGRDSIGYWLHSEFNPDLKHEEGTVGACHGSHPDSAACKFYITLCKAPTLDGNWTVFGKVTRGLDIARKILASPVIVDEEDEEGYHQPQEPIVIRKVTIHPPEVDKVTLKEENN